MSHSDPSKGTFQHGIKRRAWRVPLLRIHAKRFPSGDFGTCRGSLQGSVEWNGSWQAWVWRATLGIALIVCVGIAASAFGIEQAKQEIRTKRVQGVLNNRLDEQGDEGNRQALRTFMQCWSAASTAKARWVQTVWEKRAWPQQQWEECARQAQIHQLQVQANVLGQMESSAAQQQIALQLKLAHEQARHAWSLEP